MKSGRIEYTVVSLMVFVTAISAAFLTLPKVVADGTVDSIEIKVNESCSMALSYTISRANM